jgi:ubiquitin C-terminal hydrolase
MAAEPSPAAPVAPLPPFSTRGLANLGNTCFFNAAVQALHRARVLATVVEKGQWHGAAANGKPTPTLAALQELFGELSVPRAGVVQPRGALTAYMRLAVAYRGGTQEDAAEVLVRFLDAVADELGWRGAPPAALADLFQLSLATDVRCPACAHVSSVSSREGVLSLPMGAPAVADLGAMLTEFQQWADAPDAAEGWACDRCRVRGVAPSQRLRVGGAPHYAFVALKRFKGGGFGFGLAKDDRAVALPPTWALGDGSYAVRAAVLHGGGLHGGHYTALVLGADGGWLLCNDAHVSPLAAADAAAQLRHCYAFLLERLPPRA